MLVANQAIPEFTPGNQVVDGNMYRRSTVPKSSLVDGAVTDPDQLKGLVARNDVYPGEQLTMNQFSESDTTSVAVKLKPDQRAVAFPVEPAQGMVGRAAGGRPRRCGRRLRRAAGRRDRPACARRPGDPGHQDDRRRRARADGAGSSSDTTRQARRRAHAGDHGDGCSTWCSPRSGPTSTSSCGLRAAPHGDPARDRRRGSVLRGTAAPGACTPSWGGVDMATPPHSRRARAFPGGLLDGAMPNGEAACWSRPGSPTSARR